jgi:hypothetical protein
MKPRDERQRCPGTSREHRDAVKIVELLLDSNGAVEATQEQIADRLNFYQDIGRGMRRVNIRRYHRARNHVRDRVDENGRPCCGFTVHYRKSGRTSWLALIDPSGDLGEHATAALGTVRGWVSRERQHHTENTRMIETLSLLADHALARSDMDGCRLCTRASLEIEQHGTVSPPTMAQLHVWAEGLPA